MLSKAIRIIGAVLAILVLIVLCLILMIDPPPLRLWDEDKFVLSVEAPPALDPNLSGSIERGLACKLKLHADMSGRFGRPVINFFDWLKHLKQGVPQKAYNLYGTKEDRSWAIKVDRTTNKLCWSKAGDAAVGITDPYCGPDSCGIIGADARPNWRGDVRGRELADRTPALPHDCERLRPQTTAHNPATKMSPWKR